MRWCGMLAALLKTGRICLFREEAGLTKTGNRHLYSLAVSNPGNVSSRGSTTSFNPFILLARRAAMRATANRCFSVVAILSPAGPTPDRQAFLASVFKKATQEEEELEWGSEALAEEERMQTGVRVVDGGQRHSCRDDHWIAGLLQQSLRSDFMHARSVLHSTVHNRETRTADDSVGSESRHRACNRRRSECLRRSWARR